MKLPQTFLYLITQFSMIYLFHSMLLISVLGSYYQFTKLVILDYSLKGSGTLFYLLKVLYSTW